MCLYAGTMRLTSGPGGAQCSRLLLQLLLVVVALPAVVRMGPVRTISSYYMNDDPWVGDGLHRLGGSEEPSAVLGTQTNELPLPLPLPNSGSSEIENNSSVTFNPIGLNQKTIKFMQNYGYMIKPDDDTEFLYTPEAFKDAVKEMQKFGGLPETGVVDNSTLELMATPRCGRPDVERPAGQGGRTKRYIVGSEGWKKRRLSYYLANWSPKLYSKEKVLVELRKAFDVWSVYSNLKFTESETPDADIVIFFANYDHYDGYPFDGPGGILAHAYYPYEFGHYGGDVHFDDHEGWAIRPKDEYSGEVDFFMVAVHEIGHSLGLAHSPVSGSIMFPYYKGYQPNFALDYDDIIAMWELYIKRRLEGDDEFFNTTSTSTTTTTTTAPSIPTDDNHDDVDDEDDGNSQDENSDNGASGKDPVIHVDEYDYNNDGEADARGNDTYDDDEGIKYHGDYETVDDHIRRVEGTDVASDLPSLPTLPPEGDGVSSSGGTGGGHDGDRDGQEDDFYEADRRRREKEERRREEENKRKREEEEERKRWEENRRREEAERRRQEEEERRRWEEEVRRHEEEYAKRREEDEKRRTGHDQGTTTTTTTTTTTKPPEVIPDLCEGNFDAVALLRQELFVFKGKYIWRFRRPGQLEAGYPSKLHHMFTALPRYIQRVDAAYERPSDGKIVFFVGKYFYVHDGDYVLDATPTPITDYGLPEALTQLDAVMVWAKNQKTYFFSRNLYWRYNETTQRMDDYYPRDISRWNGIPSQIDGAFTWTDGTTHFFKGKDYWQFDNARVRPMKGYPQDATSYWTGCYPKSFYARRDP